RRDQGADRRLRRAGVRGPGRGDRGRRPAPGGQVRHDGAAAVLGAELMRFLLIHRLAEDVQLSAALQARHQAGTEGQHTEMDGRGIMLSGARLRSDSDATSVRVRAADVLISDGPFAETKEQVAGYTILECADMDEAVDIAARHPTARIGTFELRP